jgi:hypothetical protein
VPHEKDQAEKGGGAYSHTRPRANARHNWARLPGYAQTWCKKNRPAPPNGAPANHQGESQRTLCSLRGILPICIDPPPLKKVSAVTRISDGRSAKQAGQGCILIQGSRPAPSWPSHPPQVLRGCPFSWCRPARSGSRANPSSPKADLGPGKCLTTDACDSPNRIRRTEAGPPRGMVARGGLEPPTPAL